MIIIVSCTYNNVNINVYGVSGFSPIYTAYAGLGNLADVDVALQT